MKILQANLGYQFGNVKLLTQALTHRSYSSGHNERLEFLGDAVLSMSISTRLYHFLPDVSEGDLSRIRAHLVREATLFNLGKKLGINNYLLLGEGELRSGGKERPSIIADALEAVIGAIYLDSGFAQVQDFVNRIFDSEFKNHSSSSHSWGKDAKTALQEWLQSCRLGLPQYAVKATSGAMHEQVFEVECLVAQLGISGTGQGMSRRIAEQAAAEKVLALLIQQYGEAPKRIKIASSLSKP